MTRHATRSLMLTAALVSATALAVPFAAAGGKNDAPPVPPSADIPPAPPVPVAAIGTVGTVGEIRKGIAIPAKKAGKGGGNSPYKSKLDLLEVGDSFHVAGKTKRSLNSTMHTANKAHRVVVIGGDGQPVTELKIGKKKDGTETRKNVIQYTENRKFEHFDVDATDPDGVGVRIFRTK